MIPKIIFEDKFIYIKNINKWREKNVDFQKNLGNVSYTEIKKALINASARLKALLKKHDLPVMIRNYTGIEWREVDAIIKVYPTVYSPSFSNPLFLKVADVNRGILTQRNIKLSFGILLHELVHINATNNFKLKNELSEAVTHFITMKILESAGKEFLTIYCNFFKMMDNNMSQDLIPNFGNQNDVVNFLKKRSSI